MILALLQADTLGATDYADYLRRVVAEGPAA